MTKPTQETDKFWDLWEYPKSFTGLDIEHLDNIIKIRLREERQKAQDEILDECEKMMKSDRYVTWEMVIEELRNRKDKQKHE